MQRSRHRKRQRRISYHLRDSGGTLRREPCDNLSGHKAFDGKRHRNIRPRFSKNPWPWSPRKRHLPGGRPGTCLHRESAPGLRGSFPGPANGQARQRQVQSEPCHPHAGRPRAGPRTSPIPASKPQVDYRTHSMTSP